jgi:hypothetical protein
MGVHALAGHWGLMAMLAMRGRDSSQQEDFSLGFDGLRPPSYFSLLRQRKVTKRKATRRWRRSDGAGSVPCAARQPAADAKLGHPWPQTVAPFPAVRLRCSAPTTGPESKSTIKINSKINSTSWIPARDDRHSSPVLVSAACETTREVAWRLLPLLLPLLLILGPV